MFRSNSEQDECTDNSHGCEHRCVNSRGDYKCECDSGYMLNVDEKHCDGKCHVRFLEMIHRIDS